MWLKALDPEAWQRYDCYKELADGGKLGPLHQSLRGCYAGMALLINMAVHPHRDAGDVKNGWGATNCWCTFEGGLPAFGALNLVFNQKPMDLMFARSAVLEHWLTPITLGERYCQTHFTKKFVMDPSSRDYECYWCGTGFASNRSLRRHWHSFVRYPHRKAPDNIHNIAEIRRLNGWPRIVLSSRNPLTSIKSKTDIEKWHWETKARFLKPKVPVDSHDGDLC